MSEDQAKQIPPEMMDKIEAEARSYKDLWGIHQIGAIFGYHLRDEEIYELKAEIKFTRDTVLKAYFKNELVQQLQQKEKEIEELKDLFHDQAETNKMLNREHNQKDVWIKELEEALRTQHFEFNKELQQKEKEIEILANATELFRSLTEARIKDLEEALRKILALNNGREEDGRTSYTECGLIAKKALNKHKTDIPETATLGCGELKNKNSGI